MKSINNYINEKLYIRIKVSKKEKKRILKAIYKELAKNKTTGKLYSNNPKDNNYLGDWGGVGEVKKDIETALNSLPNPEYKYEVCISPDNGGYRTSKDGTSQWKQYKIELFINTKNNIFFKENAFMTGTLNCHADGTIDDPFEKYDMSCCF